MCAVAPTGSHAGLNASSWHERVYVADVDLPLRQKLSPMRWLRAMASDVRDIARFRFVIYNLVSTQVMIRYHRSALGFLWTMLNPLLLLGVQAVAFSQVLNIGIRQYALYLFSGLIAWQCFSSAVESASRCLVSNEGLIRKVAAPKIIFPLSDLLVSAVNFGFALIALFLFFLLFRAPFLPQIILLVPGTLLLLTFAFGIGLIAMTLTTFFRDFEHIITVLLSAWYFLSPVLYPPHMVRQNAFFLQYNPMSYYLEFFHDALIEASILTSNPAATGGVWPSMHTWVIASACSLGALAAGYIVYKYRENDYIYSL